MSRGTPIYATVKPTTGTTVTLYSHDWTDKTTWYGQATRVVDEVATDSGDHLTYSLAHDFVVDTYHAKITGEDYLLSAAGHSYRVSVKVNDVAKTEQDPHYASGGHFTVNYASGEITFLEALVAEDVVKVTYHYAGDSTFIIKPAAGTRLLIDFAEVQFSDDIVLNDSTKFQPYGLVDVFAPHLTPSPFPSGTLLPLQNPVVYKSMSDYYTESVKSYPQIPALSASTWRGMSRPTQSMHWEYLRAKPLDGNLGMQIWISLEHNVPMGGTYCTASFYCTVEAI